MIASPYYWADGKRVPLTPDADHVAIDLRRAAALGLAPAIDRLRPKMSVLPGGTMAVVPRDLLPEPVRSTLERSAALQPVYHAAGTRIVTFPEVRVQVEPGQLAAVTSAVEASGIPADVEAGEHGQIVLRPRSGSGADALSLANFVYERAHPSMAQARFLRIVPGRGLTAQTR
jgi:hypothetical protein